MLSLAYLPGRDAVHLHGTVRVLTSGMRSAVAPLLITALLGAAIFIGGRPISRRAGS